MSAMLPNRRPIPPPATTHITRDLHPNHVPEFGTHAPHLFLRLDRIRAWIDSHLPRGNQ